MLSKDRDGRKLYKHKWYLGNKTKILLSLKERRINSSRTSRKIEYKRTAERMRLRRLNIIAGLGGKCSVAGCSNQDLEVHHKDPFSKKYKKDYLLNGYDVTGLALFCSQHHKEYHNESDDIH